MRNCRLLIKKFLKINLHDRNISTKCMDCLKIKKKETFIDLKKEEDEYKPIAVHHKNRLIAMRIPAEEPKDKENKKRSKSKAKSKKKDKSRTVVIATCDVNKKVTFESQKLWAQAYVYGGR